MSKNFTKKDFVRDTQPEVRKKEKLEYRYPAMQPDDRDFVTDDDSDNGQWDAQLAYDVVRSKMRKAEKALKASQELEAQKQAVMDAATVKFDNASEAFNVSMEKRAEAYKKYAAVMDELRKLEGDMFTPVSKISDAITDLDSETEDYVECKLANISRERTIEDLKQTVAKLEEAEMAEAISDLEEKYKRKAEVLNETWNDTEEANTTTTEEEITHTTTEEATTTTGEPTAAEAELARLKSKLENLTASEADEAKAEEARKAVARNATKELQDVLDDAHTAVDQNLAQRKSLTEQKTKAKSAIEAAKYELKKAQAAVNATSTKYKKIQGEGDALEAQLKDARKTLQGYKGYAKFTDDDSSAFRSSYGLVLAGVFAACFLN